MSKYCIGCAHLTYKPKGEGCDGYSTLTPGWSGSDAMLSCDKGHWTMYMDTDNQLFDLERAMEHAATCPDFAVRPATP